MEVVIVKAQAWYAVIKSTFAYYVRLLLYHQKRKSTVGPRVLGYWRFWKGHFFDKSPMGAKMKISGPLLPIDNEPSLCR